MKIADFFVQITAKGDLKELKALADAQKAISAMAKRDIAQAKVKVQELKKETEQVKIQAKEESKKPKTLKEYLMAQGKVFTQQNKMNMLLGKGVLQTMGLSGAIMSVVAAAITASIAIDRMVTKLAQANQLYSNFQRQTGMSMGSAIGMSGAMAGLDVTMSPQDIMQNMQNLQNNIIGMQFGQGNIAPYQMAGINPFGLNSANMMDVIRKQLKGFAPAYRTYLLQQMGLDPRLGALIDLSDAEYLKQKQEALELYLSPEDRERIQELAPEWNKVNLKFAKAWDKFTLILMENFTGLAKEIGHLVDIAIRVGEIINTVIKPLLDILTMVLKPIYYLLDDFLVWLLGGESILGDIFHGDFPTKDEWGAIIGDAIGISLKNLWNDSKNFTNPLAGIGSLGSIVVGGIGRHLMPDNIGGGDKNISMQNNFEINVGSTADGYEVISQQRTAFNGIMAQLNGGYA